MGTLVVYGNGGFTTTIDGVIRDDSVKFGGGGNGWGSDWVAWLFVGKLAALGGMSRTWTNIEGPVGGNNSNGTWSIQRAGAQAAI